MIVDFNDVALHSEMILSIQSAKMGEASEFGFSGRGSSSGSRITVLIHNPPEGEPQTLVYHSQLPHPEAIHRWILAENAQTPEASTEPTDG